MSLIPMLKLDLTEIKKLKKRFEALGHYIFYLTLKLFGLIGAYALLYFVVLVYVCFSRRIHSLTRPYLKRRFPNSNFFTYWYYTFNICLNFGKILIDRAWIGLKRGTVNFVFPDQDLILKFLSQRKGLILLSAHVGSWQVTLAALSFIPVPVYTMMRYEEEEVAKHYFELQGIEPPFKIIRIDQFLGGVLEAVSALERGGVLALMGDRIPKGHGVKVKFLGSEAEVLRTPFALARTVGCDIVVLFSAKVGLKTYEIKIWDIILAEEALDLEGAALRFAKALEKFLEQYPFQWFNFFDFWKKD